MFKGIFKATNKSFSCHKSHLNNATLLEMIEKGPKVLIIMCHGDKDKSSGRNSFCMEDKKIPTLVYRFNRKELNDLKKVLKDCDIKVTS